MRLSSFWTPPPARATNCRVRIGHDSIKSPCSKFRHAICTSHTGTRGTSLRWRPKNEFPVCFRMAGFDKKMVILLAMAALNSIALTAGPAQPGANEPEPKKNAPGQNQPPLETGGKTGSLFANDPNFQGESDYNLGHHELFYRTIIAVVFVIVLGAAAIYVSRKLLPKIARLPGKEIRIAETVHLGPRKAVHLLEIGDRRFLIGSTNENITKLADLTDGFRDLPARDID